MKPRDLKELALQIQSFCQAFLEDKIDSREFKTMLMTLSFTAAGVSDDEMKAFNTVLQALYQMKSIGREEVLDVFKNVPGDTQEIVSILEAEPIRQEMIVGDPNAIETKEKKQNPQWCESAGCYRKAERVNQKTGKWLCPICWQEYERQFN